MNEEKTMVGDYDYIIKQPPYVGAVRAIPTAAHDICFGPLQETTYGVPPSLPLRLMVPDRKKTHNKPATRKSGFAALGFVSQKDDENTGCLMRAAHAYGADMMVFQTPSLAVSKKLNTSKAERHIPTLLGDVMAMKPYGARVVAVEFIPSATSLVDFTHPDQAYYIFGPEGASLPQDIVDWADDVVYVPTTICMNLAACANVVLYDRLAKRTK